MSGWDVTPDYNQKGEFWDRGGIQLCAGLAQQHGGSGQWPHWGTYHFESPSLAEAFHTAATVLGGAFGPPTPTKE